MKKILFVCLVIFMTMSLSAQNNTTYLLFEFMRVKPENTSDYLQVEQFWSGIHKQRIADKSIIGWDLWSLQPSGTEQGSQFLTVTLFSSLESMLNAIESLDVYGYAKKAYPNMSDKQLSAMFDKTVKSRDLANRVLFKEINTTKGDFKMQVGTIVTLDVMKQLDDSYEKAEDEIFKPWHQKMVDDGKKGSWGLLRTILPTGSTSYGTHIAYSMYKDATQLANFMEAPMGDMDLTTKLAVQEGLKTREWKELKIGKLEMMAR